jgi:hypothetical protein
MNRANARELPLLVDTRGCPVDAAAVRGTAESVLARFQITPLDPSRIEVPLPPPWLYVNVVCLDGGAAFRTDVDFVGRFEADFVRLSLNGYGGLGLADDRDAAYILAEIEQRVEAAVADYVKVNSEPEAAPAPETTRRSNRSR